MYDLLIPIQNIDPNDRLLAGGKTAGLARLHSMGLPVPNGYCVPADCLAQESGTVPPKLITELQTFWEKEGKQNAPWALRSSATVEDSQILSFAGQFETVLNITSWDELTNALTTCVNAAQSHRLKNYSDDTAGTQPLALLLQRYIHADCAGVLFTRDPSGTSQAQLKIEYTDGPCSKIVSGQITPHTLMLSLIHI